MPVEVSELRIEGTVRRAEVWPRYALGVLLLYAVVRSLVAAQNRLFWLDEIFTWIMVHQPTFAALWKELSRGGLDFQPVLYYLTVRAALVFPNPEIALRIPSVAGFACVLASVFVFVHRRCGPMYGLLATLTAMLTGLYMPYSVEARPYSLLAACVALALVAYQRVESRRWSAALALVFATAECIHYYAVFAIVPFAVAEAFLLWQTSKMRWRVWAAFVAGTLPLAAFWPILARYKIITGGNFWAQPSLQALTEVYGELLNVSVVHGLVIAATCVLALSGEFFLQWRGSAFRVAVLEKDRAQGANFNSGFEFLHERVLLIFLLASPFTVFLITKVFHGGYTSRYMIYAILGIPLTVGLALPSLGRRAGMLISAALLCTLVLQEAAFWHSPQHSVAQPLAPPEGALGLLENAGYPELPIVVANWLDYPVLAHYAPPTLAARLMYVQDPKERDYAFLPEYCPWNLVDAKAFVASHSEFLLDWSSDSWADPWMRRLIQTGYRLRPLAASSGYILYLVTKQSAKSP